jgi:hypothetical protein
MLHICDHTYYPVLNVYGTSLYILLWPKVPSRTLYYKLVIRKLIMTVDSLSSQLNDKLFYTVINWTYSKLTYHFVFRNNHIPFKVPNSCYNVMHLVVYF